VINNNLNIYGYSHSPTTAQEYGSDSFEEYEAGNDCAEGAVE